MAGLLLAVLVLLAYAQALPGVFQFDDYNVIADNPDVQTWQAWAQQLQGGIRPLLKLSYLLDWSWGAGAPWVFHLTNVCVHWGSCVLIYGLGRTLQCQPASGVSEPVALAAAALFALHPAQTEAVAYVCGRSSSLMAFFYLAAVLAYAQGASRAGLAQRVRYHGVVPLCFVLAMLVKETAVTLPLALLLWEAAWGADTVRATLRRQGVVWLVALAAGVYMVLDPGYRQHWQRSLDFNTLSGNVATQAQAYAYLMRQAVLPLWLNIDPDLPVLPDFSAGLGALGLLLLSALAVLMAWRRYRMLAFAGAWAILHTVPLHLVLPRLDVANDRQLYLVLGPLLWAVCVQTQRLLQPRSARVGCIVLALVYTTLTLQRVAQYRTEIALWEDTVQKSPGKARVHNNLGYAYVLAQRTQDARREFTAALQLDPDDIKARFNLRRLDAPD